MSETANKKWLTEDDGTKIVPRTLISCVQDEDGNTLQESVDNMLVIEPEETTEIPDDITSVVTSQDIHNIVSDVYDNTKTYSVGDYCIKDNMLYKCNTEITEAEEFDSSKWDATTCGNEFDSLTSKLSREILIDEVYYRLFKQGNVYSLKLYDAKISRVANILSQYIDNKTNFLCLVMTSDGVYHNGYCGKAGGYWFDNTTNYHAITDDDYIYAMLTWIS